MDCEKEFCRNRELSRRQMQEAGQVLTSWPVTLTAILTNRCNLQCIMCGRVKGQEKTLPADLVKNIYGLFPYLEWVDWQGGEVFMVDYFKELFLEAAQYGHLQQSITTNGSLIDEEWARIFAHSRVNLVYSIDGVTKEIYESVRRGAKFERLLDSLDLVNKYRNKTGSHNRLDLSVVVMRCNYRSLTQFVEFCVKYNFQHLNLSPMWPDVPGDEDIFFQPDVPALDHLRQAIPEIKENCRKHNIEVECFFESFLQNDRQTDLGRSPAPVFRCAYPWTRLHIECDGTVKPACQCEQPIGRLQESSLQELWNSQEMQKYRRMLADNCAQGICSRRCLSGAGPKETVN